MGGGSVIGECAATERRERRPAGAGENVPGENRRAVACESEWKSAKVGKSTAALALRGSLQTGKWERVDMSTASDAGKKNLKVWFDAIFARLILDSSLKA